MVVVVILGMVATMAKTTSGDSGEYRLDLIQTQIGDARDMAQSLARSTRTAHGLVIDIDGERLAIVDEDGELALDPVRRTDYLIDFKAPDQPTGLDLVEAAFGDGANILFFDPQGEPYSGGSITIGCRNAERVLSFDPVLGEMTSS